MSVRRCQPTAGVRARPRGKLLPKGLDKDTWRGQVEEGGEKREGEGNREERESGVVMREGKEEEWWEISGKKIKEAWRVALTFLRGGKRSNRSVNSGGPSERV